MIVHAHVPASRSPVDARRRRVMTARECTHAGAVGVSRTSSARRRGATPPVAADVDRSRPHDGLPCALRRGIA
jgi:hypothetical protein